MKADERVSERISHLERDIKILKNEVQAVLVDLREKYMLPETPVNASSAAVSSQPVVVLSEPVMNKAKPDTDSRGVAQEKEAKDKGDESSVMTEPAEHKKDEPARASEAVGKADRDKKEDLKVRPETVNEMKPGAACEEAAQARISEEAAGSAGPSRDQSPDRDLNMIRIGGLVTWAEESVKKLGLQRTEAILDVAEMMGLLSHNLRQILTKLITTDSGSNAKPVSARVFLDSLVKITTLLGKDNQTEAALLSILSSLSRDDDYREGGFTFNSI